MTPTPSRLLLYILARNFAEMPRIESEEELQRLYNLHLTPADQRVILARMVASVPEMSNYVDTKRLFCGLPDKFSDDDAINFTCNNILVVFIARHLIVSCCDDNRSYTRDTNDKTVIKLREYLQKYINEDSQEDKEPELIKYKFTCPNCGSHELEVVTDARTVRPVDMNTIVKCTGSQTFRTLPDFDEEPMVDEYDRIGFRCRQCGKDDWKDEAELIRLGALTKIEDDEHTTV